MPRLPGALVALLLLALPSPAAASRVLIPRVPAGGPGRVGEVQLSERAAAALGVSPGDTVEAAPTAGFDGAERYVVRGVYRPQADPVEVGRDSRYARFHVDDLERLSGQHDAVQRFVIRLADPARAAEVRDRLQRGAVGFDVYTSQDLADRASGTFVVISAVTLALPLGVAAAAVAAWRLLKTRGLTRGAR